MTTVACKVLEIALMAAAPASVGRQWESRRPQMGCCLCKSVLLPRDHWQNQPAVTSRLELTVLCSSPAIMPGSMHRVQCKEVLLCCTLCICIVSQNPRCLHCRQINVSVKCAFQYRRDASAMNKLSHFEMHSLTVPALETIGH